MRRLARDLGRRFPCALALALAFACFSALPSAFARSRRYLWLESYSRATAIAARVRPPAGFRRVKVEPESFADWLRHLPLRSPRTPVLLHTGEKKKRQDVHAAVIDMDIGPKDLLHCADAIIRLRAEYLYSVNQTAMIAFNFTSGDRAGFLRWARGYRPTVRGNRAVWSKKTRQDPSYRSFRRYLDNLFMYAGSASLSKELRPVTDVKALQIGDVFIQDGYPGHAVIVVDMATHEQTGRTVFLLLQGYMPAQDLHILKNPNDPTLSPWYGADFGDMLKTPEWAFKKTHLKRF